MPNWSICADIGSFKKPVFCVNIISKHTVTNEAPPQDIDLAVFRLQKDIAPIPIDMFLIMNFVESFISSNFLSFIVCLLLSLSLYYRTELFQTEKAFVVRPFKA